MRDKILEIIQENYSKFSGTNEAELHASVEIEEFFKQFLSDFGTKIKAIGFNEGFDEANLAREKQIELLTEKYNKCYDAFTSAYAIVDEVNLNSYYINFQKWLEETVSK